MVKLTTVGLCDDLSGTVLVTNSGTAINSSKTTITSQSTGTVCYPTFVNASTGDLAQCVDTNFLYNPSTSTLACANVKSTGDISGASISTSGTVKCAGLNASSDISGRNIRATGDISGASITTSGVVKCAGLNASSDISGASITTSGVVKCTGLNASLDISGRNLRATGDISGASITTSGVVKCTGLNVGGTTTFSALPTYSGTNATSYTQLITKGACDASYAPISGSANYVKTSSSTKQSLTLSDVSAGVSAFSINNTEKELVFVPKSGQGTLSSQSAPDDSIIAAASTYNNAVLNLTTWSGYSTGIRISSQEVFINAHSGTVKIRGNLDVDGKVDINGVLKLNAGTLDVNTTTPGGVVDEGNRTQTYINFGIAGTTSDFALLRQIGGDNEFNLALDFYDDGNDAGFVIRDIQNLNPDTATERFKVKRGGGVEIMNGGDASSSTAGGSLTVTGGAAIAQQLFVGTDLTVEGDTRARKKLYIGSDNPGGGLGDTAYLEYVRLGTGEQTSLRIVCGNDTIGGSSDNVNFKVAGVGINISDELPQYTLDVNGTFNASGVTKISNTTDATSSTDTNAALLVKGGVAIEQKLYVGTDLNVSGTLTASLGSNSTAATKPNDNSSTSIATTAFVKNQSYATTSSLSSYATNAALDGKQATITNINNLSINAASVAGSLSGTTYSGTIVVNGGASFKSNILINGIVTATSFNANSDYRLKENIQKLVDCSVDNLNPVSYILKNNKEPHVGFLAHELQEYFPTAVTGQKDGETMQSVNYMELIPVLVKEIQNLKQETKCLKNDIEYLKGLI